MSPSNRIKFNCPQADCGHRLKAGLEMAGRRVKCSRCGRVLIVPASSDISASALLPTATVLIPAREVAPHLEESQKASQEKADLWLVTNPARWKQQTTGDQASESDALSHAHHACADNELGDVLFPSINIQPMGTADK